MAIPSTDLLEPIKALHGVIRDAVVAACEAQSFQELASVAKEEHGDTIFQIDRVSEEVLVEASAGKWNPDKTALSLNAKEASEFTVTLLPKN